MTFEEAAIANAAVAHDMSMSDDPVDAALGRCLKFVNPAFEQWLKAESERGSSNASNVIAMSETCGTLMACFVQALCKKYNQPGSKAYEDRFKMGLETALISATVAAQRIMHAALAQATPANENEEKTSERT